MYSKSRSGVLISYRSISSSKSSTSEKKYSPVLEVNELYVRFTGSDELPWLSNSKGINKNYVWFLIDFELNYAGSNLKIINLLEDEIIKIANGFAHLGKYNNINNVDIAKIYKEDGIKFLELANKL